MIPLRFKPRFTLAASVFLIAVALLAVLQAGILSAEERFPPPDFGPGVELPKQEVPAAASPWWEYVDSVVLLAALSLSSVLVLVSRSRRGILLLTIFSLAYFGFWRKGCVCSIGAIQNVTLALFEPSYALPWTVAVFFFLPLAFALFFGRTFCAAVCPLGAIQDLVLVRAARVPHWLEHGLRLLAYVYLGLAVLYAATASAFVICEYDPFVAFFRRNGASGMLLVGAAFLLVGMVIGRPYCRFFCPYGVLLGIASRVSKWRVTITPDSCIQCKLCEQECPFGAIEAPEKLPEGAGPPRRRTGLVLGLVCLTPVLAVLGGVAGAQVSGTLSRGNRTVALAERVWLEDTGKVEGTTDASDAFRATGRPVAELQQEALAVREKFSFGAAVLGALLGLMFGIKLVQAVLRRPQEDYEVHRAACFACGRCYYFCPQEHERLKEQGVSILPEDVSRQL